MPLRTISSTEGKTFHYRLESSDSLEIIDRIAELRLEAKKYGGQCCASSPHLMPNGQYRAAVWIDPVN